MKLRSAIPVFTLSVVLAIGACCGCSSGSASEDEATTAPVEQPDSEGSDAFDDESGIPAPGDIAEESSSLEEVPAAADDAALGEVVSSVEDDQSPLSETQRNSMAMLNYLAVVTEDINSSKNSRLKLEETYSTLINNTYPNAVDDRTLAQLEGLLDTIEGYRMVDVKRDRLEYIYEQNQAQAMRAAIPNPLGLLSAVESGSLAKLAASVVYMAVDSYTSYQSATASADLEFLKGGWELDDEEASILHERRKDTFAYMVRTVSDYDLPGYFALNEESVTQLVEWAGNDNVVRRIRFLESNQGTYKAYGGYWLILASSYYQNKDYQKCLSAVATYETLQSGILRKDYDYAHAIPMAIVSASETMGDSDYAAFAEEHVSKLIDNCDNTDWEMLYFAAQTYVDLYRRTENEDFLRNAYELALDNVNFLVGRQEELNDEYLASIVDAKAPAGATKQQKDEVKQYNKMRKETRKTALPPVYQPLLVNCDLLFALADKIGVSESDRARIDGILHPSGDAAFLIKPIDDAYRFEPVEDDGIGVKAEFDGAKLTLGADLLSASTTIEATKSSGKKVLSGEWVVKKVDRKSIDDVGSFVTTLENKDIDRNSYKDGDVVTFTFTDGEGDTAITRTLSFKASVEERLGFIPNKVTFEQVEK